MFHAKISRTAIDYESPGERGSYLQVDESCRYGGTGISYPPMESDTRGR